MPNNFPTSTNNIVNPTNSSDFPRMSLQEIERLIQPLDCSSQYGPITIDQFLTKK